MNSPWLNWLGTWNPQFLRECRGRLKTRTVVASITISVVAQILILAFFNNFKPSVIDYTSNWLGLFRFLNMALPYFLFSSGGYALISDLALEERRGTLNFIRLSPRSSVSILLGKMLGVPILSYFSLALMVPLHLISALRSAVPISFLLSFYTILLAGAFCLFSLAMLIVSFGNSKLTGNFRQSSTPIAFAVFTVLWFTPAFIYWNQVSTWYAFVTLISDNYNFLLSNPPRLLWMNLQINENFVWAHLFTLANLFFVSMGIWQVLRRRFYNPSGTFLSKFQSYALAMYAQIYLFGFEFHKDKDFELYKFLDYSLYNFIAIFLIVLAVTPKRQAVIDWLRFERPSFGDWIWSEKSPAMVGVVINLVIINCLWVMKFLTSPDFTQIGLLTLLSQAFNLITFAVIMQLILLLRVSKPETWLTGAIAAIAFLPLTFLGILQITPNKSPELWLIFCNFSAVFWKDELINANFLFVLTVQALALIFLGFILMQRLKSLKVLSASAQN